MKILLLESLSSPVHYFSAGEILDVSVEEGTRLIKAGVGEEYRDPTPENPEKKLQNQRNKR